MPERYGDFRPTGFDSHLDINWEPSEELSLLYKQKEIFEEIHGKGIPEAAFLDDLISKRESQEDRNNWFVVPCGRTRDSSPFEESNFYSCLGILGGESDTVEIHSFNHWAVGWLSIILVHPSREKEVENIETSLESYPVLDDEDLSEREFEAMQEDWNNWAARDFEKELLSCLENMANKEPEGSEIERALQREKDLDEFMPDGGMTYRIAGIEPPTDSERLRQRIEEIENWTSDQLRKFAFEDCEMEWESHDSGASFLIDKAVKRAIDEDLFWDDPVLEKETH